MRALYADRFDPELGSLRVIDMPKPEPAQGEVLVRVTCAPVNPADVLMLQGRYIRDMQPPFVPGILGVGVVEGHRAGLMGGFLKGKRVTFASTPGKPGSWAEWTLAPAGLCVPLPTGLKDEDGVNLLGNAATALALVDTVRRAEVRAVVLTAAASEVGRLINRAAGGLRILNVVRDPAQAELLRGEGARDVLVSSEPNFPQVLQDEVARLGVTGAVDSIGGGEPLRILVESLPKGAAVWFLGQLSEDPVGLEAMRHFIGRRLTVRGFVIDEWFLRQSLPTQLATVRAAGRLLVARGPTAVRAKLTLDETPARLRPLMHQTTGGKVLIMPEGRGT